MLCKKGKYYESALESPYSDMVKEYQILQYNNLIDTKHTVILSFIFLTNRRIRKLEKCQRQKGGSDGNKSVCGNCNGSKNMLMKVYEISGGKGFRTVDEIRYEYELGKEAYFTRKITFAQIEEICNVLMEFQQRMREYAITEFRCYATSAIRNAKNQVSVLNQIKIRTGVDVIMLSNSELRFLMYKGIQVLDIVSIKSLKKILPF